ncbi:MAG: MarR family transcriptional regulator [Coriobacteriia bacterium]|nr:MarR family transcriptional regulator [Coriobacteriia bacterium]
MGYDDLAAELMDEMKSLHSIKPQQHINEAFRGEAFILDYIATHEGTVLPSEIGHVMDVSSARIANALGNLEKKGLITRRIDTGDRRRILIELTAHGKEMAHKHHQAILGVVSKMLSLLGEDDAKEYVRINKRLSQILPDCDDFVQ